MILGLDRTVRVAILGAGNLGLALADYPGFRQEGFAIVALFDTERSKIGRRSRGGVRIYDISEFRKIVKRDSIDIAVVAVPADSAQGVVNTAVQAGVRAILNFSPGALKVPPEVKLKNVDLTVSLESLSFFLARMEGHAESGKTRARLASPVARGRARPRPDGRRRRRSRRPCARPSPTATCA